MRTENEPSWVGDGKWALRMERKDIMTNHSGVVSKKRWSFSTSAVLITDNENVDGCVIMQIQQ